MAKVKAVSKTWHAKLDLLMTIHSELTLDEVLQAIAETGTHDDGESQEENDIPANMGYQEEEYWPEEDQGGDYEYGYEEGYGEEEMDEIDTALFAFQNMGFGKSNNYGGKSSQGYKGSQNNAGNQTYGYTVDIQRSQPLP